MKLNVVSCFERGLEWPKGLACQKVVVKHGVHNLINRFIFSFPHCPSLTNRFLPITK